MMSAVWRIILYLMILVAPLVLTGVFNPKNDDNLLSNLGQALGLLAFAILIMQVGLAARLKWVEKPFGLNLTFPFHRSMGVFVAGILIAHPLLLAAGSGKGWHLLIGLDLPWYIWLGKATLLLLLINVALSVFRGSLGLKFEKWRLTHDILGPAILVMAFLHSWYAAGDAGRDLSVAPMQGLWVVLLTGAVLLFGYHRFIRPWQLGRHPYRITEVRQETPQVWTLKFAPPPGENRFDFLPGQFQFVTLKRGRGLPVEEHHFTISSSPAEPAFHTSTIKASGDFTASIGQTRVGDLAIIHGPFGRFSHVLKPQARDLVFIAAGIGITPLMSNVRHMRDTQADRRVLLLYSNKTENDIVFREELAQIGTGTKPQFQVIHLLTQPDAGWPGEKGRLDREKIQRLCGNRLTTSTFFLCCPPPMTRELVQILAELGVPDSRIFFEYFSL
jgi:predicted ferric reductase